MEFALLRSELSAQQSSAAIECLSEFDGDFEGELRLTLTSCYHAAIARSIIASLTWVPWSYDEAELARLIDKSGGALSQMKTPGGCYASTPAYVALRSRWQRELEQQQDTQITDAVFLLFQHSCVQCFERLGIAAFCKLLAGDTEPHRVRDLLSVRTLRWIQESMFIYRWHPCDATTISLQTIKTRYPSAEQCEADSLAQVMSVYGRSTLLFYHMSSGAKFDDQFK